MGPAIIIVNYNTKTLLRQCLRSITNYEIIVVDNGSTDGSQECLKRIKESKNQRIKVLFNKENLGFAKAVNQALRQAQGEYILLLNPDIKVKKNALKKLIKFAKNHPEAGIIGARLLNPDGTTQGSCFPKLSIANAIKEFWLGQKGVFEKYAPRTQKPVEVEAVVGACMLIAKKVIEKVGFFDERYFLYFEDLDYCRRVKKSGWKVYYLPEAEFIHDHGAAGKDLPVSDWLKNSSKIYHGKVKYYLLTFIIWLGQKWQRLFKERKV